ncbi:platelet-activating factor receptor-like [Hemicordylus capensis]|uniref:platelet-activating factor receptor-like n=1 Tax=Hemicordylus capensis TaxID=884348 RepID=UPI0023029582|nr:platelet-activating factor receptor-like [Hemicordylus capensis]
MSVAWTCEWQSPEESPIILVKVVMIGMNNSTTAGLASGQCQPSDPMQFILLPATYCLVLCVGLPGNIAALLVFLQSGRVRKAIRIYLINLTLADIFFNLTLPFWIPYYLAEGNWDLPEAFCRLAGAVYYLATYSAMAFMTLISLNRYCTVAKLDLALNKPQGALVGCIVSWVLCFACAVPSLATQQTHLAGSVSTKCFEQHSGRRSYAYAMVGLFAASFLVVLGAYMSIMRSLLAAAGSCQGGHRRRARAMVLGMLLVFVVCVAPYHLSLVPWVADRMSSSACSTPSFLDNLHMLSMALLSLNSCIDPLIYCFAIKRFRTDLWTMVRKVVRCLPLPLPPPSPAPLTENRSPPNVRSSSLTSS